MNHNRALNTAPAQQNVQNIHRIPTQQQRPSRVLNQPITDPLLLELRRMDAELMNEKSIRSTAANDINLAREGVCKMVAAIGEHSRVIANMESARKGKALEKD